MTEFYVFITSFLLLLSIYHQYKIDRMKKLIDKLMIKAVEDMIIMSVIIDKVDPFDKKEEKKEQEKEILKD